MTGPKISVLTLANIQWQDLFKQQAALSANGSIYQIEGATHISLVDKQEHAAQTSAIILKIVEAVRNK